MPNHTALKNLLIVISDEHGRDASVIPSSKAPNRDSLAAHCFKDQRKWIEELGGEEACRNAYLFCHITPRSGQARLDQDRCN